MAKEGCVFGLRLGENGENELSVTRFWATEALSEPFSLEVDFTPCSGEPLRLQTLLGAEARLSVRGWGGEERPFHGILSGGRVLGRVSDRPHYRAVLSPQVALLGYGQTSRTFLGLTVPEIVQQVLKGADIPHRWEAHGSYPLRECTAQYRESDLTFVMRLLEQEGIFFRFEQSPDGCTMVVADGVQGFKPSGQPLPFRRQDEVLAGAEEYLHELTHGSREVPSSVVLRDYQFQHPALDLTVSAMEGPASEEVYEYPGGYSDPAHGKRLARIRLEELRFGASTWTGKGSSPQLCPGQLFEVAEHPVPDWNQKLLAVRVTHSGSQQTEAGGVDAIKTRYEGSFLAIAANGPYRPKRRTPRPSISGFQRATVVGPEREEIHTDAYARVKLEYHWKGASAERPKSGWVRTMQATAGSGFGSLYLPRVGQEVLVSFEKGNPDRPMVMGAVYHGAHPPPVLLPDEKTRSTFRSQSTPNSMGYNELRFEDEGAAEEVFLRAQKDENIEVLDGKTQRVGGQEVLAVEKNRTQHVNGFQSLQVSQDDRAAVQGNQTLKVSGNRGTHVAENHSETVGTLQSMTVQHSQEVQVSRATAVQVGGAATLTVGGEYLVEVTADHNTLVTEDRLEDVGGMKLEEVGRRGRKSRRQRAVPRRAARRSSEEGRYRRPGPRPSLRPQGWQREDYFSTT